MKKLFVALFLLLSAGAHAQQFGYADGQNGTTLFYRDACPAAASAKWRFAVMIFNNGYQVKGCWLQYSDKNYLHDMVKFCEIGPDKVNKTIRGNGCMEGNAEGVYKGNPFPDRAL
jgi:hypothetical protein